MLIFANGKLFFLCYAFSASSNDPVVLVCVGIPEELVVVVVHDSVAGVVDAVSTVVPTQGDLRRHAIVRQLCSSWSYKMSILIFMFLPFVC